MATATGELVVMAMDMMSKDQGMGTVLAAVTAKRLGIGVDELLAKDAAQVRRELDQSRVLVFGDVDADPTQETASG
tara:strand:+ start:7433 stop:7660 length:228 start_codon:yes stop_codon:yes gene_type:complete